MPRKSQAAASFPPPMKSRLQSVPLVAPKGMSKRAAAIFRDLTESVEPDHLDESDVHLLRQYAVACELAETAETALAANGPVTATGRASPWLTVQEKAHRAMTALSMRLRLSPQSRATGKRRLPFGRLV